MNEYKYVELGNRLKMLREQSGIKQGQFADKIGITRMSMSNYESGKHCPDANVLKRMADCLECSVDFLVGATEHRTYEKQAEYDDSLAELSETLCTIPEPVRGAWLDTFVETAKCIEKDLNGDVLFHQPVFTLFHSLMSLMECCFKAEENGVEKNNKMRFNAMLQLRNELNKLDADSYAYINSKSENNSDNMPDSERQEKLNRLKESFESIFTDKGDE